MLPQPHPLQRVVDGPFERARPVHWTVSASVGVYRSAWRGGAYREEPSLDYVINLPTSGVYLRGRGRGARVVDASQVLLARRGEVVRTTQPVAGGNAGMYMRVAPEIARGLVEAIGAPAGCWGDQRPLTPGVRDAWLGLWRAAHEGLEDDALYEGVLRVGETVLRAVIGAPPPGPLTADARERVRAVRVRLADEPGARAGLDALAAAVGWSRFQLARSFRRVTHQTVQGYREQLRMALALERLREPGVDLAELAVRLGYSHHSHFSARFRTRFGVTPSAHRDWAAQI